MEKIRKGNDIVILWDIFKIEDGAEVPYDLTGKSLALYLNNAVEKVKVSDFSVSENTVRMVFWGKEQKNRGIYSLTLVENEGLKGMYTVDECSAFELVSRSCLAGGSQESKVDIVTLKLRGTMMVGGGVVDDHLSDTSENAVMNRVVTEELNRKAYAEDVPQRLSQLTDDVGLVTIKDVPTKVSDLENDADYTQKEYVDSQITYLYDGKASKADLAKKQDVLRAGTGIVINGNTIYCTLDTSVFKVVPYLPETGELQKIYLVPSDIRGEKNIYKEYTYIGNKWEVIGEFTSDIDLSEYAKKDDIHTPDWNAVEGEEGHILNRTHYADFVEVGIPEDIASSEAEVTIPHIVGAPILVHYRGYVTSKYLKIDAEDHELHVLSYGPAFKIRRGSGNEIYISGHNNENHRLYIATHFVALNEIFLPETIARKSEMATINGQPLTEGGDIVIEGGEGSYDDTEIQNKLTELSAEVNKVAEKIDNINLTPMMSVTYAELVALRDNGELIAGMQYRITDYVTTTVQENTRSVGHPFDVIVTADNANTLNEVARACLHEGDTYFSEAGANLAAWQIWYSLDNDAERFAWARIPLYSPETNSKMIMVKGSDNLTYIYVRATGYDENGKCGWLYAVGGDDKSFMEYVKDGHEDLAGEDYIYTNSENLTIGDVLYMGGENVTLVGISYIEGKGVIYRMIDEWNNDCPYDFKNIQFKRNLIFENGYAEFSEDGDEIWVYTFAGQSYHINNDEWSGMLDGSLESPFGHMSDENTSTFHDNTIKPYIMVYNGNDIYTECGLRYLNDIVFLGYWEKIGSANEEDMPYYYAYCCYSNSFGNYCYSNSFGNGCYYNSFGNGCYYNSFGNDCYYNSFGNYCNYNSFGNYCYSNSFGNYCYSNSFGNGCYYNSFGNYCNYNSFGNYCYSNSFGNDCYYNSFGNYCYSNSFGNSSQSNILKTYYRYITFGEGVQSVSLMNDAEGNYQNQVQNYRVANGTHGKDGNPLVVEVTRNMGCETFIGMDSNDELRVFCFADLLNK